MTEQAPLLDVRDLTVEFATRSGIVRAVEQVDLTVAKGGTVGIVGESGSGKSVTSYAVMRILDRAGRIADGTIMFSGVDVRHGNSAGALGLESFCQRITYAIGSAGNHHDRICYLHCSRLCSSMGPAAETSRSPSLAASLNRRDLNRRPQL